MAQGPAKGVRESVAPSLDLIVTIDAVKSLARGDPPSLSRSETFSSGRYNAWKFEWYDVAPEILEIRANLVVYDDQGEQSDSFPASISLSATVADGSTAEVSLALSALSPVRLGRRFYTGVEALLSAAYWKGVDPADRDVAMQALPVVKLDDWDAPLRPDPPDWDSERQLTGIYTMWGNSGSRACSTAGGT
jgi:hypothetical protein